MNRRWMMVALLACTGWASAASIEGKVSQVLDGQTVILALAVGAPLTVVLTGIAAPLPCQPWASDARMALNEWVLGREVRVQGSGRADKAGLRGTLWLDSVNINQRLVEEGHAWSTRGRSDKGPFVKQERMAHALARGLHAEMGAVSPATYLRRHGPCVKAS